MSKIKKDLSDKEAIRVVNTLLMYIMAEGMAFNLTKTKLYGKKIKMHLNALSDALAKYGDIYNQLNDISTEKFNDIIKSAEIIALPFLNGVKEEHIDVLTKVIACITQKRYSLQLSQLKSILSNVKKEEIEDSDKLASERAINALLIFIIAQDMTSNLEITQLYNRSINMHLNALIKELENNPLTFEGLDNFSKQNYIDMVKATKMISIPILNTLQAEHYPIVSGIIIVLTNSDYKMQLAQVGAILVNVKDKA